MVIEKCVHINGRESYDDSGRFDHESQRLFVLARKYKEKHDGQYYAVTRRGRFQKVEPVDFAAGKVERKGTVYRVEAIYRRARPEEYSEWALRGQRLSERLRK